MGNRILTLYANDEDIILAKSKQLNLSSLFRKFLAVELNDEYKGKDDKKIIEKLKVKLAKMGAELEKRNIEIEQLKRSKKPEKSRIIDLGVTI